MHGPHIPLQSEELGIRCFVNRLVDFFVIEPPSDLESDCRHSKTEGRGGIEADKRVLETVLQECTEDDPDEVCPSGGEEYAH